MNDDQKEKETQEEEKEIRTIDDFITSRGEHFGKAYTPKENAYWKEQRLMLAKKNAMGFPGQLNPLEMWDELRRIDEGDKQL